jgi:hypothetical protein
MSESIRDILAREAREAEARAEAEERGEIAPAPGQRGRRRAGDPSQVYPVRIPVSRLRRLREVAASLHMQPTALIRQWIIERLDELDASTDADSGVAHGEYRRVSPGELNLGAPRRHTVVTHVTNTDQVDLRA